MMNFTIDVRLTASPELLSAIQNLTSAFTGTKQVTESAQKSAPAPKKPAKMLVEKPAESVKETPVTESPAETKSEQETVSKADEPSAVAYTIEQVRAVVKDKSTKGKKDEVKALLAEFGTNSVTNMDESQYADFVAKVEAL